MPTINFEKSLVGKKIGRLKILGKKKLFDGTRNRLYFECVCECGKIKLFRCHGVLSGNTGSCGCLGKENRIKSIKTHGMSNTKIFSRWKRMLQRCQDSGVPEYKRYGARGIRVCDRWQKFENFYQDMGLPPGENYSIDRINNDGDYSPENCRWATPIEQGRNKRKTAFLTINGQKRPLTEWCEIYGKDRSTVRYRLRIGLSPEEALTKTTDGRPIGNKK